MKIKIANGIKFPKDWLDKLVKFAGKQVYKTAKRKTEGWAHKLDSHPIVIHFKHSRRVGGWSGFHYGRYSDWAIKQKVKGTGVRIGKGSHQYITVSANGFHKFPQSVRYPKWKARDMPEHAVNNMEELYLMLIAHELSHVHYAGTYEGEYNCELIASDVVTAWRKERVKI